jgi:hypothetical protein
MIEAAEIRFKRKIGFDYETLCWPWTGYVGTHGYGRIGLRFVHRLSWEMSRGPIPNGKQVLHRCDNKICVNPSHLFIGSPADNMRDKSEKGRQGKMRKLTDDQVREIRASPLLQKDLAIKYDVSAPRISLIKSGKRYKYVRDTDHG